MSTIDQDPSRLKEPSNSNAQPQQSSQYKPRYSHNDEKRNEERSTSARPERRDHYQQNRRNFDNKRDFDKRDFDKRDFDKRDFDKRDFDKRDFDKRDFDKRDFDKRDFDKRDFDKRDFDKRDFDKKDRNSERYKSTQQNIGTSFGDKRDSFAQNDHPQNDENHERDNAPDTHERYSHDDAHERESRPRQQNRFAARPPLGRKQPPPAEDNNQQKKGRQPFDGKDHLYEIIKVRLARSQRLLEVNTNEKPFAPNTRVLVRIHRNVLLATTVGYRYRRVAEINSLPYILREANEEDVKIDENNTTIEKHAQELATSFAIENNLQMKVLSADLSHDHKNITINFASDVRVDFREMVAFLAGQLKLRVEMYQLGLRNGTGLICALGSCGQRLCCGRFLGQFDPVAVKLLRAQGLATNPKRISGVCGRLYCCLSYEYVDYLKEKRSLPKKGKRVLTRWGLGKISDIDLLREEVVITYDNGETQRLPHYDYVSASDDIIAKVESEEITFPLEPARFYLNHDPSAAVESALHTKSPAPQPAKPPHSRHVASPAPNKTTLPEHRKTTLASIKQTPLQSPDSSLAKQVKRKRLPAAVPQDITTNAAGLVIRRKPEKTAAPAEEQQEERRSVRKAKPRHTDEARPVTPVEPRIIQSPKPNQARPLPQDNFHPSNPRRRRPHTRPPIKPNNNQ